MSVITGVCNKQIKFRETGRAREASNAGVFSRAFVWEGQNTSSPKFKKRLRGRLGLGTRKTVCNSEVSISSGCL